MEMRHLRSFLVLAEELHFGRAAERLHVAQPALSQQLKSLERSVGATLVERSTRRVALTPAGELLRDRAEKILAMTARAEREIDLLAAGATGVVSVGFVGTAIYELLPQITRRLRDEAPGIHLEVRGEVLGADQIDAVLDGRLDLGVLRPAQPAGPGLVQTDLRSEPLVAVLPAGHALADRTAIDLAELADEPFVTYPSNLRSTMHPRVVEACRLAGFTPQVALEVGETGTLVVMVAGGIGVSLVPASVRELRLDGVAYVPLSAPDVRVPLALVRRSTSSPACLRVAQVVAEVAAS